ncbi:hypothetical protein PR048_023997 [Dryococelus australis]|uniref:Uncharacterized protein n=1 Tax=Dryococelus australis TaxID=614101 RepID=A0ABQ9GVM3_9NEOP|nr:hypothetical protein PR048_023997 [Dryococelus australis]
MVQSLRHLTRWISRLWTSSYGVMLRTVYKSPVNNLDELKQRIAADRYCRQENSSADMAGAGVSRRPLPTWKEQGKGSVPLMQGGWRGKADLRSEKDDTTVRNTRRGLPRRGSRRPSPQHQMGRDGVSIQTAHPSVKRTRFDSRRDHLQVGNTAGFSAEKGGVGMGDNYMRINCVIAAICKALNCHAVSSSGCVRATSGLQAATQAGGNGRSLRKPSHQRHRPARFPHAKSGVTQSRIEPGNLGTTRGQATHGSSMRLPPNTMVVGEWEGGGRGEADHDAGNFILIMIPGVGLDGRKGEGSGTEICPGVRVQFRAALTQGNKGSYPLATPSPPSPPLRCCLARPPRIGSACFTSRGFGGGGEVALLPAGEIVFKPGRAEKMWKTHRSVRYGSVRANPTLSSLVTPQRLVDSEAIKRRSKLLREDGLWKEWEGIGHCRIGNQNRTGVLPNASPLSYDCATCSRRNSMAGKTGIPRQKPATDVSHAQKSSRSLRGIDPVSPLWEASKCSDHYTTTAPCNEDLASPMRLRRVEYGIAPDRKGTGNGRVPRKPADKRHSPARVSLAEVQGEPARGLNPVRLSGKRAV